MKTILLPAYTISLPAYGIEVTVNEGCGSITSDLKETAPYPSPENEDEAAENDEVIEFNLITDGIESLILGLACAGVDIDSPAFLEGIESAVQCAANNL